MYRNIFLERMAWAFLDSMFPPSALSFLGLPLFSCRFFRIEQLLFNEFLEATIKKDAAPVGAR